MKKILCLLFLLSAMLLTIVSCDNDDENSNSILVNVFVDGGIANPTIVQVYDYNEAKDFDRKAISEMGNHGKLVDKSGNTILPQYISGNTNGVNIIEDVKNGKYLLVAMHKPDGFTFSMFYYYGFKVIDVNPSTNGKLYNMNFEYAATGKFIEF